MTGTEPPFRTDVCYECQASTSGRCWRHSTIPVRMEPAFCPEHGGPANNCEECAHDQWVADDQASDDDWYEGRASGLDRVPAEADE